ncbi:DUF2721 domain-containing protein [Arcobacteraceae bacterium]|nr:DUF2721 domain-containing protein [Arcobacteraceae bacterium]
MIIPNNDAIIHLIQLSVAPVFLIAGVAGLLNVFASRLIRILDRLEALDDFLDNQIKEDSNYKKPEALKDRRKVLIRRMQNINWAIFFGTTTGLMVALVILSVFASSLLAFNSQTFISIFFILAMISLSISLILFLREIFFTTSFIKIKKYEKH